MTSAVTGAGLAELRAAILKLATGGAAAEPGMLTSLRHHRSITQAVAGLDDAQLDTPYREGGWTIRQVVHHVADSHANSYIRFKLALTEDWPIIKPYDEASWAELVDSRSLPVSTSLDLLTALHARWVALLRTLKAEDWERTLNHPEAGVMSLDLMLGLYAWHCEHHVAHITALRSRMGW